LSFCNDWLETGMGAIHGPMVTLSCVVHGEGERSSHSVAHECSHVTIMLAPLHQRALAPESAVMEPLVSPNHRPCNIVGWHACVKAIVWSSSSNGRMENSDLMLKEIHTETCCMIESLRGTATIKFVLCTVKSLPAFVIKA
jgi:hypothetical protein